MNKVKRLLLVYLSALALLLVSVTMSMVLTGLQAEQLEEDANDINTSGRQRMLSQRIIYLAQDFMTSTGVEAADARAALLAAVAEFEAVITVFEESHSVLSQRPDLGPELQSLYFAADGGPSLDARIREYIRLARLITMNPNDTESLRALKSIERQGLLRDLDGVVTNIESASIARVAALRRVEFYSLCVAFLIVLVEVGWVFLPGHRFIQRTLSELQDRNAKLDAARAAVFAQNEELLDRNFRIARDSDRLQAAWEESEALRKEQADFTYSVSHDLKSPTNTIHLLLNEISVTGADQMNDDARELLDLALQTCRRMGEQIEDVLQYSAATDENAQPAMIDVRACIDSVLSDMRSDLADAEAVVEVKASGQVFGYATQMRILIQNLIGNAVKFRAEGVRPEVIVLCTALSDHSGVIFTVADNGIGIAPENHERIFGLFQRLHVRETYPGTGLGLATCQRIALNHNGQIMVSSAVGEGSTFEVILRAVRQKDADASRAIAA